MGSDFSRVSRLRNGEVFIGILLAALLLGTVSKLGSSRWGRRLGPSNDMLAAADIRKGREIANECTVCHSFEAGGPNRIGPNLFDIVGSKIARDTHFDYSVAMRKLEGSYWTIDNMDRWLKDPAAFAPENKMLFSGLLDPQDRMDLIAYMMTLH